MGGKRGIIRCARCVVVDKHDIPVLVKLLGPAIRQSVSGLCGGGVSLLHRAISDVAVQLDGPNHGRALAAQVNGCCGFPSLRDVGRLWLDAEREPRDGARNCVRRCTRSWWRVPMCAGCLHVNACQQHGRRVDPCNGARP